MGADSGVEKADCAFQGAVTLATYLIQFHFKCHVVRDLKGIKSTKRLSHLFCYNNQILPQPLVDLKIALILTKIAKLMAFG